MGLQDRFDPTHVIIPEGDSDIRDVLQWLSHPGHYASLWARSGCRRALVLCRHSVLLVKERGREEVKYSSG